MLRFARASFFYSITLLGLLFFATSNATPTPESRLVDPTSAFSVAIGDKLVQKHKTAPQPNGND